MVRRSPWELPQALLALAHRQGGCVTAAQAAAVGLNANAIARRMLHGRSRRHLGCIVLVARDTPHRHALDAWAMTLRLQPVEVVVSGSTALHLKGRHPPAKLGDCMIARVARATKRRLPGVILMAQRHGDRTASRSIRGLLVHHPTQALLDIIATVAPDAAQAWLNWALHERLLTEQDLRREVARVLPRRGGGARTESGQATLHDAPSIRPTAVSVRARQGAATLDESPAATPSGSANVVRDSMAFVAPAGQRARGSASVVGHSKPIVTPPARLIPVRAGTKGAQARTRLHMALNHVAGGTRSEAERRLTSILRSNGIRGIRTNWPVASRHDAAPIARIDLAHPATKLAIEVDGRAFHSSHEAFECDRERQGLLAELGWLTIRFTWSMLATDPARVAERVRSVIASRAAALRTERCRTR